jgi:hypothetical protein
MEAMDEMPRLRIALMDERIVAFHLLSIPIVIFERRDVRIVLPKVRTGSPYVRDEFSRIGAMKIAHRRRQHHQISGGLEVL